MKYLILALVLAGCTTKPNIPAFQQQPIKVDSSLLEPCKPLRKLDQPSFSEILASVSENAQSYNECSSKHRSLVNIIEKLTNGK